MIRLKAATLSAVAALLSAPAQANDGAPPHTFEGSGPGPVLELNDQGKPTFQAVPEPRTPVTPGPEPVAAPAPVRAPAPVVAPAPVAPAPAPAPAPVATPAPAPVTSQPASPGAVLQPAQGGQVLQAPPIVTPVTTAPLQWETPPQGQSPFADQKPVPASEPEPAKSCTKEEFDRGMCIVR